MKNAVARKVSSRSQPDFLVPDNDRRNQIERESSSDIRMCWTCGSCDFECPVNVLTGSLRPQRAVRLGNLGFFDDLLKSKEIWYCLDCHRCGQVCPNQVKPWALMRFARQAAVFQKKVSWKTVRQCKDLWTDYQRVRWQIANVCLGGGEIDRLSEDTWRQWLSTRIPLSPAMVRLGSAKHKARTRKVELAASCQTPQCFTCGECGSVCPISSERGVFDIRAIIRMINLKMVAELLASPSIWLCLSCYRCSTYCSQDVDGEKLIRMLQDLSLASGIVDHDLKARLERSFRIAHRRLLHTIDGLIEKDSR